MGFGRVLICLVTSFVFLSGCGTIQPTQSIPNNMVFVSGGTYIMASNRSAFEDELPHIVKLSDFYLSKFETTVGEWREFVADTGYISTAEKLHNASVLDTRVVSWEIREYACWSNVGFKQTENDPVVCVSWSDCIEYCNWKSKKEGLTPCYSHSGDTGNVVWNSQANGYRLPTEAEWEYAARNCGQLRDYPWGNGDPMVNGKPAANLGDESAAQTIDKWVLLDGYTDGYIYTSPVGTFLPNELGIYDMAGNVWEWCWDWYETYDDENAVDPTGPAQGSIKVFRGGGWFNSRVFVRTTHRAYYAPGEGYNGIGFRIARNIY